MSSQLVLAYQRRKFSDLKNFWLQHHDFKEIVQSNWQQPSLATDSAKLVTAKFKRLGKCLKIWSKSISNLAGSIHATNNVILMWDFFEEYRMLTDSEHNGREMLKEHLLKMLSFRGFIGGKEQQLDGLNLVMKT